MCSTPNEKRKRSEHTNSRADLSSLRLTLGCDILSAHTFAHTGAGTGPHWLRTIQRTHTHSMRCRRRRRRAGRHSQCPHARRMPHAEANGAREKHRETGTRTCGTRGTRWAPDLIESGGVCVRVCERPRSTCWRSAIRFWATGPRR